MTARDKRELLPLRDFPAALPHLNSYSMDWTNVDSCSWHFTVSGVLSVPPGGESHQSSGQNCDNSEIIYSAERWNAVHCLGTFDNYYELRTSDTQLGLKKKSPLKKDFVFRAAAVVYLLLQNFVFLHLGCLSTALGFLCRREVDRVLLI